MKNIVTFIFAGIVLIVCILAFILVPNLFPQNENEAEVPSSSKPPVSSALTVYTVNDALELCDSVVTGTVIKADVVADGVQYTLQIGRVYKGRNYTSMGYAFLKGKQTLELAKTYLFMGITGNEKYHYFAPFSDAPWVYLVEDGKVASHSSNGKENLVTDIIGLKLDEIKEICDRQKTRSK